jgi:RES domain-containing protein
VASQELVARVDALGATALETVAFRHVTLGANPRSGTGARIHGGRWNPPNSFATLYLGLDVETVSDEFHRMARRQGLMPDDFLPRELYRFDVRLTAVLDLREVEARQAIELSDPQLRADDPHRCQEIGEGSHYRGLEGIVAPSAAGPGCVLAIFLEKLGPDSLLEPLRSELWDTRPPRRS